MNSCICCGAEIPEGRQVCPNCEAKERFLKTSYDEEHIMRVQAEAEVERLLRIIDSENDINILRERAREE